MPQPSPTLCAFLFILFLLLWPCAPASPAPARTYELAVHHRFSPKVRKWAEARGWHVGGWWPRPDTPEYYAALVNHDRAKRGERRRLSDTALTFSDGNLTFRINKLGFLHYAEVSLGTPATSFLVALDTGSDLFWVPCDCKSCASASSQTYGLNLEFGIYSPSASLTSKKVLCNNSLCEFQATCSEASEFCPYKVAYISSETSSSGVLVEDILYLTTEDARREAVEARVTFGCGEIQTGSFLDSAAPNGLFGLGMEKVSVPSILASLGLVSDSFSMCFGLDGLGRISFGDKGTSDQDETPFSPSPSHPTYIVSVTGMQVGSSSYTEDFNALIDSGTSFTTLSDPAYTHITQSFDAQVRDKRSNPDPQIPFECCYLISSNQPEIPVIHLTMKGGSQFPIINPIIFISVKQGEVIYCLAVVKGGNWNIIGQNFMTGLRVVFDREKLILGWKNANCSEIADSSLFPVNPRNPRIGGSSTGPNSYNPEATKQTGKTREISVVQPSSQSQHRFSLMLASLFLFQLLLMIL